MSNEPFPESAQEAVDLADAGKIREVLKIRTKTKPGSRFPEVCWRQVGDFPAPREPDGFDEWEDAAKEPEPAPVRPAQPSLF